jgi:hypothetical protein
VTTDQRVPLARPVVSRTPAGARALARAYWCEVERFTRGGVRVRAGSSGVELRLLGGPALLRFGPARTVVEASAVLCTYSIVGGLLARRAGGSLVFGQTGDGPVEIQSRVEGFHPRLAARPGLPAWTGALYTKAQARLHDAIGRRFLAHLAGNAAR